MTEHHLYHPYEVVLLEHLLEHHLYHPYDSGIIIVLL